MKERAGQTLLSFPLNSLILCARPTGGDDARARSRRRSHANESEDEFSLLQAAPAGAVQSFIRTALLRPLLRRLSDRSEKCREAACQLLLRFCGDSLFTSTANANPNFTIKEYTAILPYLFPAVVDRSPDCFVFDPEQNVFARSKEAFEAEKRGRVQQSPETLGGVYVHTVHEPSEEVRLLLCRLARRAFFSALRSGGQASIGPYFHDAVRIFQAASVDPFPTLKVEAYEALSELAHSIPAGLKHFAVALIKSIMPALRHRHAKIRTACLSCIDALMQCPDKAKRKGAGTFAIKDLMGGHDPNKVSVASFYGANITLNYFAALLMDGNPGVRLRYAKCLRSWLVDIPDRYDWRLQLLPYVLTLVQDDHLAVQEIAVDTLEKMGKEYEQEHREEVLEKKQYGVDGANLRGTDYTQPLPSPFKGRPRVGARVVVRDAAHHFIKALLNDLAGWNHPTVSFIGGKRKEMLSLATRNILNPSAMPETKCHGPPPHNACLPRGKRDIPHSPLDQGTLRMCSSRRHGLLYCAVLDACRSFRRHRRHHEAPPPKSPWRWHSRWSWRRGKQRTVGLLGPHTALVLRVSLQFQLTFCFHCSTVSVL